MNDWMIEDTAVIHNHQSFLLAQTATSHDPTFYNMFIEHLAWNVDEAQIWKKPPKKLSFVRLDSVSETHRDMNCKRLKNWKKFGELINHVLGACGMRDEAEVIIRSVRRWESSLDLFISFKWSKQRRWSWGIRWVVEGRLGWKLSCRNVIKWVSWNIVFLTPPPLCLHRPFYTGHVLFP